MSNLKAFLFENAERAQEQDVVVSKRFKDEAGNPISWKIRPITEAENENIRRSCTRKVTHRGTSSVETDNDAYITKLVAEAVVYPDLKDAELQASYGVMGADTLLKRMLLAGEFGILSQAVSEISGFDKGLQELKEEAKN